MTPWLVDFEIVPDAALRRTPGPFAPGSLADTPWWEGVPLPRDYRARLDAIAPREDSSDPAVERWGSAEGSRLDVRHDAGVVRNILARVDVRRLDARFGAALLVLVRDLGATLVRRDGVVVQPTIGAFGAALRGSAAWRHANDPAEWIAAQPEDDG